MTLVFMVQCLGLYICEINCRLMQEEQYRTRVLGVRVQIRPCFLYPQLSAVAHRQVYSSIYHRFQ